MAEKIDISNKEYLNKDSNKKIESLISELLIEIKEDPSREGLIKTPLRVSKSWDFITSGYHVNIKEIVNNAIFYEKYDEMVTVLDIDYFSMCEHHLLPFFGKAQIGYIPDGKVIGLSKLPRIVEVFSRRLQLQERLTQQIAECIDEFISPKGVAVILDGQHMCMQMRGVQKQNSFTTTSYMLGLFREDPRTRKEFLHMIPKK